MPSDPGAPRWKSTQQAYDAGYANPSGNIREQRFPHLVFASAFRCGQLDAQNTAPANRNYREEDYEPETFERIAPKIELGNVADDE